jgi:hypothetical protein
MAGSSASFGLLKPQIQAVRAISSEIRSSRGRYLSWSIAVVLAGKKPLLLSLGNRQGGRSTDPLTTLAGAMTALLGKRP